MDDVRSNLYVLCLSILFLAHFRLGCPYLKEICDLCHKIGHTSISHQHPKVIHERLLHDGIIAPPSVIIFNVLNHRYLQNIVHVPKNSFIDPTFLHSWILIRVKTKFGYSSLLQEYNCYNTLYLDVVFWWGAWSVCIDFFFIFDLWDFYLFKVINFP